MIEQPPPPGCTGPAYLQMHLASAPVTLIMNNPNYTALLAFCEGNLKELSAMPNAQNQPDAAKAQNTTFNSDFRFGPPVGMPPTFRMTLDIPEFMVRELGEIMLGFNHARFPRTSQALQTLFFWT